MHSPDRTTKLSPWVKHVMKVMKEHNCSLKEAMELAKKTFKKGSSRRDPGMVIHY
jgi:hypothetical protein